MYYNIITKLKEKTTEDIEHLMKLRVEDENKAKNYCREADLMEAEVKDISDQVKSVYKEKTVL